MYRVAAGSLGFSCDEQEILRRVNRLRSDGVIRRLGAVFDSRSLGYASTLVAGRVPPERLDEVAATVSQLPGVTHNYRREHARNLWFTLTARSEREISEILDDLRRRTGIASFDSLPALAVYKIRVNFAMGPDGASSDSRAVPAASGPPEHLDEQQEQLVRLLQEDLSGALRPFDDVARKLGWPLDRVLEQIDAWRACGVIRRFGAVVQHRRLGFEANGMAAFDVPPDRIDEVGRRLAERPEISHCYRRPALEDFPYNLFAMIPGRSADDVREVATQAAERLALSDYDVLFSTAEYKKESMRYFTEPCGR